MIRVVIVDDQTIVRAGVSRILGPIDGFEVVAECADGDEVLDAVVACRPDVVLMDVRMRRMDGVTATRRLTESGGPPVRARRSGGSVPTKPGRLTGARLKLIATASCGR